MIVFSEFCTSSCGQDTDLVTCIPSPVTPDWSGGSTAPASAPLTPTGKSNQQPPIRSTNRCRGFHHRHRPISTSTFTTLNYPSASSLHPHLTLYQCNTTSTAIHTSQCLSPYLRRRPAPAPSSQSPTLPSSAPPPTKPSLAIRVCALFLRRTLLWITSLTH